MAYSHEYYLQNKEAYASKSKAWRIANPERAKENRRRNYLENKERNLIYSREYNLKHKFNLTQEQYDKLLEEQKGVCAICNKLCSRSLAVDHDHKTGEVRGLLCNGCNRGIGYLKEDPYVLQQAIAYLTKSGGSCGV